MELSVALCTFNGAKYLKEQLDSIVSQTHLPDELVVCDDGSSDATLRILEDFQKNAPFPVKIFQNSHQLGPAKNFEKAMSLCAGEIISFCDQDDVWLPQKLETLLRVLLRNPEASYVFSNAMVVDAKLNPLGFSMWESIPFDDKERQLFRNGKQFNILLRRNVVTGAAMAIRSKILDWILPIPREWMHDAWITFLVGATGGKGVFVEAQLIKYRQHVGQVLGAGKTGFYEKFRKTQAAQEREYLLLAEKFREALGRLHHLGDEHFDHQEEILNKINHLLVRDAIGMKRGLGKLVLAITELLSGRYHKFSNGLQSVAKDLFFH